MAWLITHRCIPDVAEPVPYAIQLGSHNGEPVTRIVCVERGGCNEEFFILGHDLYRDAEATGGLDRVYNLPRGFMVARKT